MNLYLIPFVLAMGDPNFVPGNPPNQQFGSQGEAMMNTTDTLNQIEQPEPQSQEDRDYNRNEPDLLLKMDDIFREVSDPDAEKSRPKAKEDL